MDRYVVDTSILMKWLNTEREEHVTQAEMLLHDAHLQEAFLSIPDLAVHELNNALLKGKQLTAEEACEDLAKLLSLPLIIVPFSQEILFRAAFLAEQYSLSVYDATFLALAAIKRCPLITENVKHQGVAKEIKVIHIADYPTSSA